MQDAYERCLLWSLNHRRVILGLFVLSILASGGLFSIMPQDFLPSDDTGQLTGQIQAQNGTSFDQMCKYLDEVARIINADPNVEGVFGQFRAATAPRDRIPVFNIIV